MFKRVCLLVNYNLYESKRHFTKKIAEAFNRKGIETKIIDLKEQQLEADIAAEIQLFDPDFTCSFNSFTPLPNGKFLWDIIKIPHLSFLVDPSFYSIRLTNSPYSFISCVDRFDVDALKPLSKNVMFLPHAVEKEISIGNSQRLYDVVFLGSCYDYESLQNYWKAHLPSAISAVLDEAIELVLSDQQIPLAEALATAWGNSQLSPNGVDFNQLFYYLDQYTRGKDRVEAIRAIKDAPVHIFGELMHDGPAAKLGWHHYLGEQKNITIHASVPYEESFKILQKAKICLNSMPFFKNGSHERVLMSFATGALPISSSSIFWNECFADGLPMYHPKQWKSINPIVTEILDDESTRKAMVEHGRDIVMQKHTWDNRVEQLLQELIL